MAIQIVDRLTSQHGDELCSAFPADLPNAIREDKRILEDLLAALTAKRSVFKRCVAWCGGKLSSLKLDRRLRGKLGSFEAAEILSLGILGKRALWRLLQNLERAAGNPASGLDFRELIDDAERQFQQVENWRLEIGSKLLLGHTSRH